MSSSMVWGGADKTARRTRWSSCALNSWQVLPTLVVGSACADYRHGLRKATAHRGKRRMNASVRTNGETRVERSTGNKLSLVPALPSTLQDDGERVDVL